MNNTLNPNIDLANAFFAKFVLKLSLMRIVDKKDMKREVGEAT